MSWVDVFEHENDYRIRDADGAIQDKQTGRRVPVFSSNQGLPIVRLRKSLRLDPNALFECAPWMKSRVRLPGLRYNERRDTWTVKNNNIFPWNRTIHSYTTASPASLVLASFRGQPPAQYFPTPPNSNPFPCGSPPPEEEEQQEQEISVRKWKPYYLDGNPWHFGLDNLRWQTRPYGQAVAHNQFWWNTRQRGNPQLFQNKHFLVGNLSFWGSRAILYYLFPESAANTTVRKTIFNQWSNRLESLVSGSSIVIGNRTITRQLARVNPLL